MAIAQKKDGCKQGPWPPKAPRIFLFLAGRRAGTNPPADRESVGTRDSQTWAVEPIGIAEWWRGLSWLQGSHWMAWVEWSLASSAFSYYCFHPSGPSSRNLTHPKFWIRLVLKTYSWLFVKADLKSVPLGCGFRSCTRAAENGGMTHIGCNASMSAGCNTAVAAPDHRSRKDNCLITRL